MPLGLDSLKGGAWLETYARQIADIGPGDTREIVTVYDWRLYGGNGELVCSSLQGFTSQADAEEAALRAQELFAQITEFGMPDTWADLDKLLESLQLNIGRLGNGGPLMEGDEERWRDAEKARVKLNRLRPHEHVWASRRVGDWVSRRVDDKTGVRAVCIGCGLIGGKGRSV